MEVITIARKVGFSWQAMKQHNGQQMKEKFVVKKFASWSTLL